MTEPQTSPGPAPDPVSALERVLDLALYGPVGLAVTAREELPHWAEIGRRQVEARLTVARVVGRLAVGQGSRQGGDLVRRLAEQADALLAALGLVSDTADEGEAGSVPERNAGSVPERNAGSVPDEGQAGSVPEPGSEPARSPASGPRHGERPPSPAASGAAVSAHGDPAHLPIPGYDTLSASQVVQRLPGLSAEELEAVRRYEMAGRARQTILLKAAQLRTGP